jgi:integrase
MNTYVETIDTTITTRKRSPVTTAGYLKGRIPVTKGKTYPPDPFKVEDIVRLLDACVPLRTGKLAELSAARLRALIILLWRSGLRISEALALEERDLNSHDHSIIVRHGKFGKRRISAMDDWGWRELGNWLELRRGVPLGVVFCVLEGPTAGQPVSSGDIRRQLRQAAKRAGLQRRANPHSFRHTHAVELWRENIDVYRIQQQLGHARLDVTAIYLRGVSPIELLEPIGNRKAPLMRVPSYMRDSW